MNTFPCGREIGPGSPHHFGIKSSLFGLIQRYGRCLARVRPASTGTTSSGKKQTILLDFRHEQDEEMRRFKMLWAFLYLYEWIKTRGRWDDKPFGLIIDEFAHMTQQVASGNNPL